MVDPLEKDYGVLLGVTGPILLQRARDYRVLAEMVGGKSAAGQYLLSQAQRAEEAIVSLGRKFDERR